MYLVLQLILCFILQKKLPRRRSQPVQENVDEHKYTNPLEQFVHLLVGALQNRLSNNLNLNPPAAQITTFKDFKNVGPPEFKGIIESIEAQAWIKEIEKAFVIVRVGEDQKTIFVTYMIKSEGNFQWERQTKIGFVRRQYHEKDLRSYSSRITSRKVCKREWR